MPRLFDFKCKVCGAVHEYLFVAEEHIDDERICICGGRAIRQLPVVRCNMGVGAYGYFDETLGTYIESNAHKREVMRQQGVTPKGDTPKPNGEAWV